MKVRVLSRAEVESGAAEGADAVVSIRPASSADPFDDLDLAVRQAVLGDADAILVLRFDDIGIPGYGSYVGPTIEDVAAGLEFCRRIREVRPDATVAVHCEMGRSRSAAVALALLADRFGPGREEEAVATLLRDDADCRMIPNPLLVGHADDALLRCGRLESALASACPRYVRWRDHWRQVALDPEKHWEQARRTRVRRRAV